MTELTEAVADRSDEAETRRTLRVAAAIYEMSKVPKVRQVDLVNMTGYSRETIRRHVEDEQIRRGEIPPTDRYLAEQERAAKKRASRFRPAGRT